MIYAKNNNGKVSIYRVLPKDYQINGIKHNLSVLPIETINEQGFFELVVPTITETQRLESLLPTDLIGTQYIQRVYNYTQAEIDADIVKAAKDEFKNNLEGVYMYATAPDGKEWALKIGNDGKTVSVLIP